MPLIQRLNVLVFVAVYIGLAAWYVTGSEEHQLVVGIAAVITGLLHILSFLFTHWSVEFRAFVAFKKVSVQ